MSVCRVLGFRIRDTSELFKENLRNIIIKFVVDALFINYHDVYRFRKCTISTWSLSWRFMIFRDVVFSNINIGTRDAPMHSLTRIFVFLKASQKKYLSHNAFLTTSYSQRLSYNVFLTTSFPQRHSHNVVLIHLLMTSFSKCRDYTVALPYSSTTSRHTRNLYLMFYTQTAE